MKTALHSPVRPFLCPLASTCCLRSSRKVPRRFRQGAMPVEDSVRRMHDLVQDLRRDFRYDPSAGEPA